MIGMIRMTKTKQIKFAALIFTLIMALSGCGDSNARQNTESNASSEPSVKQYVNLPAAFEYTVPYDDVRNDGDELGNYRIVDGEISMETSKNSYCTDSETIAAIYGLIDTENMKPDGEITDENRSEYDKLSQNPAIHLVFDKLYFVSVYINDTVVTQTFYTEGEKYEQLANEYYKENGTYPPAISDGLWKYSAADHTYSQLSKILLDLPEEQKPES